MVVGTRGGAVEHHFFQIPVDADCPEHAIPDSRPGPAGKAGESRMPGTERLRQVAPRGAGASDPQHRFDKASVVARGHAGIARLAWQ